jgi:hypothetical protein
LFIDVAPRTKFYARHFQRGVHANPICNPKRDAGKRGRGDAKDRRVPLRIADWVSAGRTITCGMEHFAPPDKGESMLHVPAQGLNYVASRGLLVADFSFSAGPKPVALRFRAEDRSKADSSLIHLFTSAMDQQVSEDIRSQLEHCTLEELLTDNKVTSPSLLGELRRLTARSILRSVNGVSQGCPRGTTTVLKL